MLFFCLKYIFSSTLPVNWGRRKTTTVNWMQTGKLCGWGEGFRTSHPQAPFLIFLKRLPSFAEILKVGWLHHMSLCLTQELYFNFFFFCWMETFPLTRLKSERHDLLGEENNSCKFHPSSSEGKFHLEMIVPQKPMEISIQIISEYKQL